ncbi:outer membrane lipoprotein carrier protein LolA [bacterium]|nr:outer membrane lipoprotein carrier protein LolA [bacterium]
MKRLLATGALVVLYLSSVSAQTTPLAVLEKMGETYSKIEAMSCSFTLTMGLPGMPAMSIPTEMKMQRPNLFRTEVAGAVSVSDGTHLYVYLPMLEMYQKLPAPVGVDFRGATSGPLGDFSSQGDLMGRLLNADNAAALAQLAQGAEMKGEENVSGVLCHRFAVDIATGVRADLWVDKDKYLLRKMQMDMLELLKMMKETMGPEGAMFAPLMQGVQPGQMMLVQEYTKYDLAPKFAEDTFRFTPPPGAREGDLTKMAAEAMKGAAGAPAGASPPIQPKSMAPVDY